MKTSKYGTYGDELIPFLLNVPCCMKTTPVCLCAKCSQSYSLLYHNCIFHSCVPLFSTFFISFTSNSIITWLLFPSGHKNIKNEETARGQLMTYTRQFLVPHPWNNPIFSHPTCHPYPYSHPTIFKSYLLTQHLLRVYPAYSNRSRLC